MEYKQIIYDVDRQIAICGETMYVPFMSRTTTPITLNTQE